MGRDPPGLPLPLQPQPRMSICGAESPLPTHTHATAPQLGQPRAESPAKPHLDQLNFGHMRETLEQQLRTAELSHRD